MNSGIKRLFFFFLPLLAGCGYHVDSGEKIAISIPYVVGDHEGELTDALIYAIARTSKYSYVNEGGDLILQAKIEGAKDDRIGFKYDRDPKSGHRRKNIVGVENRKTLTVVVSVISRASGEVLVGPEKVKADVDYDYVDPNSILDLAFVETDNTIGTSIEFSLGQLDSVAAAGEDALYPLYRIMARKIVEGLLVSGIICE